LVRATLSIVPVIFRSVAALVIAVGLLWSIPSAFGSYGLRVHVRWTPETTASARHDLERRLHLVPVSELDDNTFRYLLLDSSTDAIQALVTDPSTADTHYIDRGAFTADAQQAVFEWADGRVGRVGRLLRPLAIGLVWLLGVYGMASAATAALLIVRPAAVSRLPETIRVSMLRPMTATHRAWRGIVAFLQRGIPIASAEAAGAFRIPFGLGALAVTMIDPVRAEDATKALTPLLAHYPWLGITALRPWLVVTGLLFVAGVLTRFTYAAFVLGFLTWATIAALDGGSHATSALAMALVMLLPSRWGDAVSVDGWLRRRLPRREPGRLYGYSIWAPGFVLGVAFAAAAWSKVKAGPGWIANGTVKYHFLSDADRALVDWGVRLTWDSSRLAVAASAAVVVMEALLITAAFSRSRPHRVALAAGAAMLFLGFLLFQGVGWPGWWLLFLSFLPWDRIGRRVAPSNRSPAGASAWQLAIITAMLLQQIYVSAVSIEKPPLLSAYDMYSASYESMDDYLSRGQEKEK
jgi:hypothetical protein